MFHTYAYSTIVSVTPHVNSFILQLSAPVLIFLYIVSARSNKINFVKRTRGLTLILNHVERRQDSGIKNLNFHVKLRNSLYINDHVIHISKLGKHESLESSQESWNLVKMP